jgi:hypothetical protein
MPLFVTAASRFAVVNEELAISEPSITRWQRLEVHPGATDLTPGLEARIADPLWLVGRQWQLAELKGEDAGTPIRVELTGEKGPIRFPAASGRRDHPLANPEGLAEPLVEADTARADVPALAAQAGLDLERALTLHGAAALVSAFRQRFPLAPPARFDQTLDPAGARFQGLAVGRTVDGRAVAEALVASRDAAGTVTALPTGIPATPALTTPALAALTEWLLLWDGLFVEPGSTSFWRDARLEYSFGLEAEHSAGATNLVVDEYGGGRLDWWSFDLGATSPSAAAVPAQQVKVVSLPVAIRYPGMPANRYWEFEDGSVNLADPKGGPTAITMMLAIEYELVASNDWFEVPLELEYGHACRIESLTVTDTFGRIAQVPRASAGQARWSMFELAVRPDGGGSPTLFVLPPVTADILEGAPIEEVRLFRDEMANLVWGVERRVPGYTLQPIDRPQDVASGQVLNQQLGDIGDIDASVVYRLQTAVPVSWFPFTAEQDPTGPVGSVVLVRRSLRRLVARPDGSTVQQLERPIGRILNGSLDRFALEEREVPRSGVIVTRAFQYARTVTGGRVLWLGRRKQVGRGEGSSALRHDVLDPLSGS